MRALIVTLSFLLATSVAHADTTLEAFGSATVTQADPAAARTRALDDAFRQAVDQIVVGLVAPDVREKQAEVIKKRVLRRSRVYVTRYKLLSEGEEEGVYQVRIEASVADGTIASDLKALGVTLAQAEPAADPTTPDPPRADAARARPRILLLLADSDGKRARTTFGKVGEDAGPAADALRRTLEQRGFQVLLAQGLELMARGADDPQPAAGLPVNDDQAAELARNVGAGAVLVVGIQITDGGRIRGARLVGAEAEATARLTDLTVAPAGRLVEERWRDAGFGPDAAAAGDAAARSVADRAGSALAVKLVSRWPGHKGTPAGGIAVRVRGASRWPDVAALVKAAGGLPGVKSVTIARLTRGEIVLSVVGTVTARAVADAIAAAPPSGVKVTARASADGEVSVDLSVGETTVVTPESR